MSHRVIDRPLWQPTLFSGSVLELSNPALTDGQFNLETDWSCMNRAQLTLRHMMADLNRLSSAHSVQIQSHLAVRLSSPSLSQLERQSTFKPFFVIAQMQQLCALGN